MFESFLDNSTGAVVAILDRDGDLRVASRHADRVSVVALPHLTNGIPIGRIRARIGFLRALRGASSFSVVGADIMDGTYTRRASVLRSHLMCLASKAGVPTQVLGFSWSDSPDPVAVKALLRLPSSVRLLLRDPESAERARASGMTHALAVADTVFAFDRTEVNTPSRAWLAQQQEAGRPVVIFNTSGLLAERMSLDQDYLRIATHLLDCGCSLLLLPHVMREGDDDRQPARRLQASLPNNAVFMPSELMTPAQVAWVASQASACITGRMHLAILAATQATPAITFASQGKVHGMLELIGVPELVISPRPGMATDAIELADAVLGASATFSARIRTRLPRVRELADENFKLVRPTLESDS